MELELSEAASHGGPHHTTPTRTAAFRHLATSHELGNGYTDARSVFTGSATQRPRSASAAYASARDVAHQHDHVKAPKATKLPSPYKFKQQVLNSRQSSSPTRSTATRNRASSAQTQDSLLVADAIQQNVRLREQLLGQLQQELPRLGHLHADVAASVAPRVVKMLNKLRSLTLSVVEMVVYFQSQVAVSGAAEDDSSVAQLDADFGNYLLRIAASDMDFVAHYAPLAQCFDGSGVDLLRNPLLDALPMDASELLLCSCHLIGDSASVLTTTALASSSLFQLLLHKLQTFAFTIRRRLPTWQALPPDRVATAMLQLLAVETRANATRLLPSYLQPRRLQTTQSANSFGLCEGDEEYDAQPLPSWRDRSAVPAHQDAWTEPALPRVGSQTQDAKPSHVAPTLSLPSQDAAEPKLDSRPPSSRGAKKQTKSTNTSAKTTPRPDSAVVLSVQPAAPGWTHETSDMETVAPLHQRTEPKSQTSINAEATVETQGTKPDPLKEALTSAPEPFTQVPDLVLEAISPNSPSRDKDDDAMCEEAANSPIRPAENDEDTLLSYSSTHARASIAMALGLLPSLSDEKEEPAPVAPEPPAPADLEFCPYSLLDFEASAAPTSLGTTETPEPEPTDQPATESATLAPEQAPERDSDAIDSESGKEVDAEEEEPDSLSFMAQIMALCRDVQITAQDLNHRLNERLVDEEPVVLRPLVFATPAATAPTGAPPAQDDLPCFLERELKMLRRYFSPWKALALERKQRKLVVQEKTARRQIGRFVHQKHQNRCQREMENKLAQQRAAAAHIQQRWERHCHQKRVRDDAGRFRCLHLAFKRFCLFTRMNKRARQRQEAQAVIHRAWTKHVLSLQQRALAQAKFARERQQRVQASKEVQRFLLEQVLRRRLAAAQETNKRYELTAQLRAKQVRRKEEKERRKEAKRRQQLETKMTNELWGMDAKWRLAEQDKAQLLVDQQRITEQMQRLEERRQKKWARQKISSFLQTCVLKRQLRCVEAERQAAQKTQLELVYSKQYLETKTEQQKAKSRLNLRVLERKLLRSEQEKVEVARECQQRLQEIAEAEALARQRQAASHVIQSFISTRVLEGKAKSEAKRLLCAQQKLESEKLRQEEIAREALKLQTELAWIQRQELEQQVLQAQEESQRLLQAHRVLQKERRKEAKAAARQVRKHVREQRRQQISVWLNEQVGIAREAQRDHETRAAAAKAFADEEKRRFVVERDKAQLMQMHAQLTEAKRQQEAKAADELRQQKYAAWVGRQALEQQLMQAQEEAQRWLLQQQTLERQRQQDDTRRAMALKKQEAKAKRQLVFSWLSQQIRRRKEGKMLSTRQEEAEKALALETQRRLLFERENERLKLRHEEELRRKQVKQHILVRQRLKAEKREREQLEARTRELAAAKISGFLKLHVQQVNDTKAREQTKRQLEHTEQRVLQTEQRVRVFLVELMLETRRLAESTAHLAFASASKSLTDLLDQAVRKRQRLKALKEAASARRIQIRWRIWLKHLANHRAQRQRLAQIRERICERRFVIKWKVFLRAARHRQRLKALKEAASARRIQTHWRLWQIRLENDRIRYQRLRQIRERIYERRFVIKWREFQRHAAVKRQRLNTLKEAASARRIQIRWRVWQKHLEDHRIQQQRLAQIRERICERRFVIKWKTFQCGVAIKRQRLKALKEAACARRIQVRWHVWQKHLEDHRVQQQRLAQLRERICERRFVIKWKTFQDSAARKQQRMKALKEAANARRIQIRWRVWQKHLQDHRIQQQRLAQLRERICERRFVAKWKEFQLCRRVEREVEAAKVITALWRGFQGRLQYSDTVTRQEAHASKLHDIQISVLAPKLQRFWRHWYQGMRKTKRAAVKAAESALIQAEREAQALQLRATRYDAATAIQAQWRAFSDRRKYIALRSRAATDIERHTQDAEFVKQQCVRQIVRNYRWRKEKLELHLEEEAQAKWQLEHAEQLERLRKIELGLRQLEGEDDEEEESQSQEQPVGHEPQDDGSADAEIELSRQVEEQEEERQRQQEVVHEAFLAVTEHWSLHELPHIFTSGIGSMLLFQDAARILQRSYRLYRHRCRLRFTITRSFSSDSAEEERFQFFFKHARAWLVWRGCRMRFDAVLTAKLLSMIDPSAHSEPEQLHSLHELTQDAFPIFKAALETPTPDQQLPQELDVDEMELPHFCTLTRTMSRIRSMHRRNQLAKTPGSSTPKLAAVPAASSAMTIFDAVDSASVDDALFLQQQGADLALVDPKTGRNALHSLAFCRENFRFRLEMLDFLLKHSGLDVNARDANGDTALMLFAVQGHLELMQRLMRQPSVDWLITNHRGQNVLHRACEQDQVEICGFLQRKIMQSMGLMHAMHVADASGRYPLHIAAGRGLVECAKQLLSLSEEESAGAQLDGEAVADCNRLLLSHWDPQGRTALHLAVAQDDLEMVELLLHETSGANVNGFDLQRRAPLHLAVDLANNGLIITSLLIERGADLRVMDERGDTPLHWAAFSGREQIVRQLLAFGADLTMVNSDWETPAQIAAAYGHIECTRLLMQKNDPAMAPVIAVSAPRAKERAPEPNGGYWEELHEQVQLVEESGHFSSEDEDASDNDE